MPPSRWHCLSRRFTRTRTGISPGVHLTAAQRSSLHAAAPSHRPAFLPCTALKVEQFVLILEHNKLREPKEILQ